MSPREAVGKLAELHRAHFGARLLGLYLFGSLAADAFHEGRSDVDLLAVLDVGLTEEELGPLEQLHAAFVDAHPEWVNRVEVGYIPRDVPQTFTGTLAAISPGEPLNLKEAATGWLLNWHAVVTSGETVLGPPPLELGPAVSDERYRDAVLTELREWREHVRNPALAYVPAAQGYAVVTVCRALYALEHGRQTTKEEAAAWAAERHPERAEFIRESLARHRADLRGPHEATIRFVDEAASRQGA